MHARLRASAVAVAGTALVAGFGLRDSDGFKRVSATGKAGLHVRFSSGSDGGPRSHLRASRAITARRGRAALQPDPAPENAHLPRSPSAAALPASRVTRSSLQTTSRSRSLHLHSHRLHRGRLDLAVTGFDPAPPREIDLWRVDGTPPVRLYQSASGASGAFTFAPLLFGGREVALVAAPRGEGPRAVSASPILWIRRAPVAPSITAIRAEAETTWLQIAPAEDSGFVLIGEDGVDEPDAVLRFAVQITGDGVPVPFEFAAPPEDLCLWAVHELPDTRRSPVRVYCGAPE